MIDAKRLNYLKKNQTKHVILRYISIDYPGFQVCYTYIKVNVVVNNHVKLTEG